MAIAPSFAKTPVDAQLLENQVLKGVFKPGRYLGLEQGAYRKNFHDAKATMALAFPDLYEIGASSYAIKLLYSVVNQHPDYYCDRVYAPAKDFWQNLTLHNMPLFAVESRQPVKHFDVVAVSLQYELNYTTVLGLLDASQIPLRTKERATHPDAENFPIILGGGPGTSNPMPLVNFFDGFMVGDGEDLLIEVLDVLNQARAEGWNREQKLVALAKLEGVYMPGYNDYAMKRIVDISNRDVEIAPLIPAVEAIHDRVTVEARRGCDRMCRFCHPAFINLPTRENDVEKIKTTMLKQLEETGYEECSLLSLSIADYSEFKHLVQDVSEAVKKEKASLSLSSQRADRFSVEVAEAVGSVRKSTLTFAPEAGTERMRDVVNKNLSNTEILKAVTTAYESGWHKVKLYFMIGLPTETTADLDGIVALVHEMRQACQTIAYASPQDANAPRVKRKPLELNITLSNFVPKPHTPFQWHAQDSVAMLEEKIAYLRERFRKVRGVKANFTTPTLSKLEAVISKGGTELGDVIERAYEKGAYLDAWDETRPFEKWFIALEELGIDAEAYTRDRLINPEEPLPWDVIHMGLDKKWLLNEWERSMKAASTTPCFDECSMCGVCPEVGMWPTFTKTTEATEDNTAIVVQHTHSQEDMEAETLQAERDSHDSVVQRLTPDPVCTLRLTLQKGGDLKFIGHLDWMRLIQRALRMSKLPVAYTKGFNPRPMMAFSPALPLMVEGMAEVVDVSLYQAVAPNEALFQLNQHLPPTGQGLSASLIQVHSTSIEKELTRMAYSAKTPCADAHSEGMIKEQLKAKLHETHWMIEAVSKKRGAFSLDIKPYVQDIHIETDVVSRTLTLSFTVQRANPLATGGPLWMKPDWVLEHLAPGLPWQVMRNTLSLRSFTPESCSVS